MLYKTSLRLLLIFIMMVLTLYKNTEYLIEYQIPCYNSGMI